jgi:peptidoglycan/xylan/chitin deacetylase (PgdA/CDA1 family)
VVIALGSYFIQLQFFIPSYCNGSRDRKQIAITFDDGPNPHTQEILDILKNQNTRATFFCIGKNIAGQEAILKRIDFEDHLIGTHSFNHHWSFPLQGKAKIIEEMVRSKKAVSDIIHKEPLLFRPPFGVTDPPLAAAIREKGVSSIGWSLRSYDTVISSSDKLLNRVNKLKNGDIILFHDAGLQTNVILTLFIKYVRSQGFEIVPLDQLLGINAYEDQ